MPEQFILSQFFSDWSLLPSIDGCLDPLIRISPFVPELAVSAHFLDLETGQEELTVWPLKSQLDILGTGRILTARSGIRGCPVGNAIWASISCGSEACVISTGITSESLFSMGLRQLESWLEKQVTALAVRPVSAVFGSELDIDAALSNDQVLDYAFSDLSGAAIVLTVSLRSNVSNSFAISQLGPFYEYRRTAMVDAIFGL